VAAPESQLPDGASGQALPGGVRRPPADPARRLVPVGFRRPPAHAAGQRHAGSLARPPAGAAGHSARRRQDPPADLQYDRDVAAALAAGDPAGIAMAYDRYAAALYGYCHWMLHDTADAARALQDTFVVAATLSGLPDPAKLRPWLFALARNQGRRRIKPTSAARNDHEEADAAPPQVDPPGQSAYATSDAADATIQFRAIGQLPDATMQFRAIGQQPDTTRETADATMQFRAVGQLPGATSEAADATIQFRVVGLPIDATMPFRVVSLPADPSDGLASVNGDREQAELRTLIYSVLAGLKPREREVIELTFRHHLYDEDLAIVLGVSEERARTLAARARSQLEKALSALHIALTRREACPVLGELLAKWDGQLTEETSDLVGWHLEECQACAHHGWGALRPEAFSRLLPLAPLPPELREQVLSLCTSTASNAVAYRRRLARRAGSTWLARFSQAIRVMRWDSIRANPGPAIAAAAVAMWVVAALSVTLLTFAGSHAAHAQETQPGAQTSANSPPAVAATSATAPTSVFTSAAKPSPSVSQPAATVPVIQPSTSPTASTSPKASASPKPSKSSSPSPSHTSSPSPSPSSSPSPSPTI
jgi:RNA polymerase sigma factor (sigma-70 family)